MPTFANPVGNFSAQLGGRSIGGGIAGGITAEISGGKFMDGFVSGAQSAAYGYMSNCFFAPVLVAAAYHVIAIGSVWLSSKAIATTLNAAQDKPISEGQNDINSAARWALPPSLGPLAVVAAPQAPAYLLANPLTVSSAALDFVAGATNTPPTASLPALLGWGTMRVAEEAKNQMEEDLK